MIRNLIFDLGGVVIKLDQDEAIRRFHALGIADAREQMGVYGQTGIFLELERGDIDVETFCRKLAEQAHKDSISYDEAQWGWLGYVKEVPAVRLQNLLKLREKYKVFLLSNTNPLMMAWVDSPAFSGDGHPISYYFDRLYCSYALHDYKPSLSIFEKVIKAEGLKADECIFVDDGLKNVEASEKVGMHGLHVAKDADWMDDLSAMLEKLG